MQDEAASDRQSEQQPEKRKIVKAKRKNKDQAEAKILDEEGNELSFEQDSDDLEDQQHIDDEVVQREDSDDWEDQEDAEEVVDMQDDGKAAKKDKKKAEFVEGNEQKKDDAQIDEKTGQIWNEEKQPLKPDEELDFDSSAYEMLHRAEAEWPCLSLDVLVRERCPEASQPFAFKDWFHSQSLN